MEEMICNTTFCEECKFFKRHEHGEYFIGTCEKLKIEVLVTETCAEAEKRSENMSDEA